MIWFLTSSTVDCYVLILGHAYNVRHFSGGWVLKVESITTITFKYNNKKSINLHSTRFKKTFSTFYKSVFGLKVYFWPIFDTLIVSIYWCWQCHCYICQYILMATVPLLHMSVHLANSTFYKISLTILIKSQGGTILIISADNSLLDQF